MGIVNEIAAKLGNPNLEVAPILSMQLNVSIVGEQCKFGVVVREDAHLENFGVNAPLNFHGQLTRLVNLNSRRVNATSYDVVLVWRNSDLLRGYLEV